MRSGLQSVAFFLVAGLREIGGLAARGEEWLVGSVGGGDAGAVWHHPYGATRPLWQGVCDVWGDFYCVGFAVGLAGGAHSA